MAALLNIRKVLVFSFGGGKAILSDQAWRRVGHAARGSLADGLWTTGVTPTSALAH